MTNEYIGDEKNVHEHIDKQQQCNRGSDIIIIIKITIPLRIIMIIEDENNIILIILKKKTMSDNYNGDNNDNSDGNKDNISNYKNNSITTID